MFSPCFEGKTTLAHVVARHAGYNVVEVNASDDRSTESFQKLLKSATQMRSVIDKDQRPNCLVFDEIDGAPAASIEHLIKFVTGKEKPKKGLKVKNTLKRPIICICNDLYVPALRSLRQIAFIVNFPPTASARLAERLRDIARHQKIKTDMGALLALCEKTHNDIRSCLSVLHFFKTLKKPVTLTDVCKSNIGQKDMQKGLFAVWQDIFLIERPKVKIASLERGMKDVERDKLYVDSSLRSRMRKVVDTVNSFGDYERLMQGVFENYPHMNIKDSSLVGTSRAVEWFCYCDILYRHIYSLQNYSLSTYLQYAFVTWHFVFGTSKWQKLTYPNKAYEVSSVFNLFCHQRMYIVYTGSSRKIAKNFKG